MNDEAAKLLIRGAVAETGLDEQFNRHLGELRQHYERIKSSGEEERQEVKTYTWLAWRDALRSR